MIFMIFPKRPGLCYAIFTNSRTGTEQRPRVSHFSRCRGVALSFGDLLVIVSDHHLAGLIDVAAAQRDDQIAFPGVLLHPVGGSLQTVHQHRAGDLSGQLCAGR